MKKNLFLLITIYFKPRNSIRTEKSTVYDEPDVGRRSKDTSWALNPAAWHEIEVPELVTRISSNKLRSAAVIIDVTNEKLIKNRFTLNDSQEIFNHFRQKYSEYFTKQEGETEGV